MACLVCLLADVDRSWWVCGCGCGLGGLFFLLGWVEWDAGEVAV